MTAPAPRTGEPAGIIGILTWIVAVLVALNIHGLTQSVGALLVAAIVAAGGLIVAFRTRPVAPAVITTAISAIFALGAGLGFHVPPNLVAALSGLILAALSGALTRPQVVPVGRVL